MQNVEERILSIARGVAEKKGEDCRSALFHEVRFSVERYLFRSRPIVGILLRNKVPEFIGPLVQRGFQVIVREEAPEFVATIEQRYGKPIGSGLLLAPIGFGEYDARKEAATEYQEILAKEADITSEIITIEYAGTEENHVVLYIP